MSPSLYSFENMSNLLSRAGVSGNGKNTSFQTTQPVPIAMLPELDLVASIRAIQRPSQRALGAALESLLGDLRRVLGLSLFVADGDGLLLAGSGDAPTMAASLAADVMHSLHDRASVTSTQLDALLVKVPPNDYLVFSHQHSKRSYVVGARVDQLVPLNALRAAADLVWDTLFMRIQHA